MNGPEIIARTLSIPRARGGDVLWQYHPRSDHHSKVACWAILFDLLQISPLLQRHIRDGTVAFGINHVMVNFRNGKKKALDLVVCRPSPGAASTNPTVARAKKKNKSMAPKSFYQMVSAYGIELTDGETQTLLTLPDAPVRSVGSVLIALEAKAAMTEFAKARPRLYDELESSHVTVHADTNHAIAAGIAIINGASSFMSPTANPCVKYGAPKKISKHAQPKQLGLTIRHVEALPRRSDVNSPGFDALCALALDCENDADVPVVLISDPPAQQPGDALYYDSMIARIAGWYSSRFPQG
jgi:hypothetical protein